MGGKGRKALLGWAAIGLLSVSASGQAGSGNAACWTSGVPGPIRTLDGIRYEYEDLGPRSPVILMVPGFTQHNRSLEFILLRDHFLQRGMSVLIMNPPQHGEDARLCGPLYGWGEGEDTALAHLAKGLGLASKHAGMHALGFSIGAKTIIRFAALPGVRGTLASVTAIAPPYRISDIDSRLSGDIRKPTEGPISTGGAVDRAGPGRIAYMSVIGMTGALLINRATPADQIGQVEDPLLLVHGSDDWLIKSNHSVRLYARTRPEQPAALVILKTRTHAEDMLSRDRSEVRMGLIDVVDRWIDLAERGGARLPKDSLQAVFQAALDTVPWVKDHRVAPERISRLDHPTLFSPLSGLWYSAPNDHPALAGAHYTRAFEHGSLDRLLLDASPWRRESHPWMGRFSAALSLADSAFSGDPQAEAGLAFDCCSTGTLIMLRRIGFWSGVGDSSRRRLVSADLTAYILNFRINYGRFFPGRDEDCGIAFSFPLIGDAASSYFLGAGYEAFLTDPGKASDRDKAQIFVVWGPSTGLAGVRPRLTFQYQQEGPASRGWHPRASAGLSLSFRER